MSEVLETVTIDTKDGPAVINKSDFDSKKHTLAGAAKKAKPTKTKGK